MSLFSYLHRRAVAAVLTDAEKESIERSLSALHTRLNLFFSPRPRQFTFGSYRRGTILPRLMDPSSDVDYMVVFDDGGFRPQTYLDRLRRFVEARYQSSDVAQSSPTIVLDLNHIRFELVPTLDAGNRQYLIPNGPHAWQLTAPLEAQRLLHRRNEEEGYRLKPAIRLLKYWNAVNNRVFAPFALEQWATNQFYGRNRIADLFCEMIERLPATHETQWGTSRLERAKKIVEAALDYQSHHYGVTAEQEIAKLIPPIEGSRRFSASHQS